MVLLTSFECFMLKFLMSNLLTIPPLGRCVAEDLRINLIPDQHDVLLQSKS
jgi:hypothetical protein